MCWKYCVPIAAVSFVGSGFVWQYLGLPFIGDLAPNQDPLAVRESWVTEDAKAAAIEVSPSPAESASNMSPVPIASVVKGRVQ